jgi:hypothetical protein
MDGNRLIAIESHSTIRWQNRTGQCIKANWILDGEWDCSDASDEEGIFFILTLLTNCKTFCARRKIRNDL